MAPPCEGIWRSPGLLQVVAATELRAGPSSEPLTRHPTADYYRFMSMGAFGTFDRSGGRYICSAVFDLFADRHGASQGRSL